jgi:dihydropteroate synthase
MGVVNVTPDSFSDGGCYFSEDAAAAHACRLIDEGADIIDIGGESTRPGALEVDLEEERRRVLPLIARLSGCGVPVSVDTRKPGLMQEAIAAGASMINDIDALHSHEALAAVVGQDVAVCLMHKRGSPADMQNDPRYGDVVGEISSFIEARVQAVIAAGIARNRIVVDPGFGFGKTLEHNVVLLKRLREIAPAGIAILAGISRKSMLGQITGKPAGERIFSSVAAALIAVQNGAHIVRVHDVAETRDVLAVWSAVNSVV